MKAAIPQIFLRGSIGIRRGVNLFYRRGSGTFWRRKRGFCRFWGYLHAKREPPDGGMGDLHAKREPPDAGAGYLHTGREPPKGVGGKWHDSGGPSGLEEAVGFFKKPDLMFVPLVVGRAAQRGWWVGAEVAVLPAAVAENSEFLDEIGRTALKARNCFTAPSEHFNKCFERDARSKVIWFMGRNSLE